MGTFIEYRQMRELAELSARHGIDLEPLVELSERLWVNTDLAPEEVYREFLQQAANMVGNLAGKAVTGVGNMVNNFKQGYQQGRGPNGQQQPQQGQQPAPQSQPQGGNGPSIQLALHHLQSLKQNLQAVAQASQQQSNQLAQHLYGTTQYLDQISQMIQQVLQARYGITWKPH